MAADLYRVVWTRGAGPTSASEPLPRDEAMRQFDGLREIRAAASRGMARLRVIREQDYRPALAAEPVKIRRGITGCRRWIPNRGQCALSGGHDGPCVPIEAR